jgi:hypothetical protein
VVNEGLESSTILSRKECEMTDLKYGAIYCDRCGEAVAIEEKPGDTSTAQRPHMLVGECGHVIAERSDKYSPWEIAS